MSNLLWVLVPLLISIVAGAVLVYRARKPQSMEHGIDEFQRELRALAPRRNEDSELEVRHQESEPEAG